MAEPDVKVTFIENASATLNSEVELEGSTEFYEMPSVMMGMYTTSSVNVTGVING